MNTNIGDAEAPLKMDIRDFVGRWYRPNFEQVLYPYVPPQITRPKEKKDLFLVRLPQTCKFACPENLKFLAIPFFELYDNGFRYGEHIASLPELLSRVTFNYL